MKKRILIVDDEPAFTRMIKLNLEKTGRYEVRAENQALLALASTREFQPDLILLDVMMPNMLGSEIAAQLQADPEFHAIKVVFLTAFVTKHEELRSQGQIGGHTFVAKPISADDLFRVVDDRL